MIAGILAYETTGRPGGTPVVLLHGFPFDRSIWRATAEALADAGCLAVSVDLPGHGKSPVATGTTMRSMADAVAKTLESVGVERAVWVGHSIGGYVALEHYARRPDDLLGLALVCSRAAADDEKGRTARNAMIARIEQDGMKSVAPSMITKLFSQETVDRDPEAVRRVERIIEGTAPEGAAEAVRAMRDRKDHTDLLTRIAVPTLVVAGADDPIVPADEAKAMAATIEGSRLRTVEDAAHMPMIESSEAFAEILVEWVTEMSVTRGWQGLSTSRK